MGRTASTHANNGSHRAHPFKRARSQSPDASTQLDSDKQADTGMQADSSHRLPPKPSEDTTWVMPANDWARLTHAPGRGLTRTSVFLAAPSQPIVLCKTRRRADGFVMLPEEMWTAERIAATLNFVESHPIGTWKFDNSIPTDQLQTYADLACIFLKKIYAIDNWKYKKVPSNDNLFDPAHNVVRGTELPPVLRFLCESRHERRTAPVPHKQYARTTSRMKVEVSIDAGPNQRPSIIHTVKDNHEINRAVMEHARGGNFEALHSVRAHAARIVATDERVRIEMLSVQEKLCSLLLDD